jgi:Centromere DNA-binding protein complex CBF3 subunit, domain 2
MAFYLFLRFNVDREPWPDFSDMLGWQKIKLLRNRISSTKKLSYSAQNLAIKTAFQDHQINLKSWTHLGRKAGCQFGEALDVPDAQIRRLGH